MIFDYLLNKDSLAEDILEDVLNFNTEFRVDALADSNVSNVQVGDIIQFDRKGFYRVDRAPAVGVPGVFFSVPTGKQKLSEDYSGPRFLCSKLKKKLKSTLHSTIRS